MSRRAQVLTLTAIMAVGLLRGGWWVAVTEVWSPVDEIAHVDFVARMGRDFEPPKVGDDFVGNDLLEVAKESATSPWRPSPLTADNRDPRWGAFAHSYEGVQPPAYYALLAPVWRVTHGYGAVTTLYVLRIATLLVALVTLPLLWLLGRELWPDRPDVALGAPALLVLLGGFNGNLAYVTNDAPVMTAATAALWLTARTWNRGFQARSAIAVGACVGIAVLSKTTALALVPLVALGALGPLWTRGTVARRYVAWGAQCGAAAAVVVLPWLLWNRATYGAWSASEPVDAITGPLQPPIPRTLGGVVTHLKSAVQAFWGSQLAVTRIGHHAVFLTLAGAAILALATAFHARRKRPTRDALAVAWTASAVPLALLTMIGIIAGVFGGSSSVVGRHLYVALPALALALVGGLVSVFGRRIAYVALAVLAAAGLTFERADTQRYVLGTYTRGVEAGLTPVTGQSRGDAPVTGPRSIRLEADCNIGGVSVEFVGAASPVTIRHGSETRPAQATVTKLDPGGGTFAFFPIPATSKTVNVDVPAGATIAGGVRSATDDRLVPTATAYCERPNAEERRFAALFHPQHPDWPSALVLDWATGWAVLGWLGALATAWLSFGRRRSETAAAPQ